jgi:hypothetical protein
MFHMATESSRREFFKKTLIASAAMGTASHASMRVAAAADKEDKPLPEDVSLVDSKTPLPQGKIGKVSISRILLGGNLLTHFTHSRDLKYVYTLCEHYNTEQKIIETMALSEKHGINTLVVHTVPAILATLKKYRQEQGGKMQWIICPTAPANGDFSEYTKQVAGLADMGTNAVYLWGVTADRLAADENVDAIAKAVAIAHEHGMPSGVGAHDLKVIELCEKHKIPADFYIKTFHHHNYPSGPTPEELTEPTREVPGYWCRNPKETAEFMKTVEKPWIAFKVMAAGAIPPKDALQYVFDNGADHSLLGMFDFEIAEDVKIAKEVLGNVNRTRTWKS